MENESSEQMQTIITFNSDIRLSPAIYQDALNLKRKLIANSKNNKFELGCPIESRNISRRSKLNTEALSNVKRQ